MLGRMFGSARAGTTGPGHAGRPNTSPRQVAPSNPDSNRTNSQAGVMTRWLSSAPDLPARRMIGVTVSYSMPTLVEAEINLLAMLHEASTGGERIRVQFVLDAVRAAQSGDTLSVTHRVLN